MKFRRRMPLVLLLASLAALSLSSCLQMEMDIRLLGNGTVRTTLVYEFDSNAADFGRGFGADERFPLPLMEKDFRQQALRIDGVELVKYRSRSGRGHVDRVEATLVADSMEQLGKFLNAELSLDGNVDSGTFTLLPLPAASGKSLSPGLSEAFHKALSETVLVFRFQSSSKPVSVNNGEISGRKAIWETTVLDLIMNDESKEWTVNW